AAAAPRFTNVSETACCRCSRAAWTGCCNAVRSASPCKSTRAPSRSTTPSTAPCTPCSTARPDACRRAVAPSSQNKYKNMSTLEHASPAKTQAELADSTHRTVTWRLMPLLLVCYLFAHLDRINIGFAKMQMSQDLQFSDTVYGL